MRPAPRRMRYDGAMMLQPVEVEAREGHRIWLRYADGAAGEVGLSDIAGQGVFAFWNDRARFESVRIGPAREITWGGDAELCPDALYLRVPCGHDAGHAALGGGTMAISDEQRASDD